MDFMSTQLVQFLEYTGFANVTWGHIAMIIIGLVFIFLGIKYEFEPLLLVPIGFGMLIGNIPFYPGLKIGIYEQGSVLNILYHGVQNGWYPPLIFLGIGAMTDFSALLSNPKLMLIGAAAQVGIFAAYMGALGLGFLPNEAGAIGIIGGADGPTAIFISSQLAPELMGAIAVSAYSYMALVPVIQPPIMRLCTTQKERTIRMKPPRQVSKLEKITFPIIGLLFCAFIVPSGLPRQPVEGVRCHQASERCGKQCCCQRLHAAYRYHRWCLHPGFGLPVAQVSGDFRPWCRFLRRRHVLWCALREVDELLPQGG